MMVRVFLIAFLMTLIALPHSYSVDWEQYNGNDSTRTTPEKIDLSTLKGNQAKVVWKVPVRNGFSSFTTAGDKIFTLVTRKDPLEYWNKLAFHQRVDSPAAYGLD